MKASGLSTRNLLTDDQCRRTAAMTSLTRDGDLTDLGQSLSFFRNPERKHVPRDVGQVAAVAQSQPVKVVPIKRCEKNCEDCQKSTEVNVMRSENKADQICLFPGIPKENTYHQTASPIHGFRLQIQVNQVDLKPHDVSIMRSHVLSRLTNTRCRRWFHRRDLPTESNQTFLFPGIPKESIHQMP